MVDEWLWCMHCQRAFHESELRGSAVQFCAYEDCEGIAPYDMVRWKWVRRERPDYPAVPERDTVYPAPERPSESGRS